MQNFPPDTDIETVLDERVPLAERIASGARLWDLVNSAKKALEPLKDALRAEARRVLGGPGAHTLEGSGMTRAVVTIPDPALTILRETDYTALRASLGDAAFRDLFEETISYKLRPNATGRIASLPPDLQGKVFEVVRETDGTPRVSFQYAGAGISEV